MKDLIFDCEFIVVDLQLGDIRQVERVKSLAHFLFGIVPEDKPVALELRCQTIYDPFIRHDVPALMTAP